MARVKLNYCTNCEFHIKGKKYGIRCLKHIGDGMAEELGILERELPFCPKWREEQAVLNRNW